MKITELTQETIKEYLTEETTALLPVGAVEVHGAHLPIGTDLYLAQRLTDMAEEKLGPEKCLVLPCIPYGQVWSLRDAPGSVHIPDDILTAYIVEIGRSMERAGIRRMAVINTHVGNMGAIKAAARRLMEEGSIKTYYFTYPGADEKIKEVCTSRPPHKGYFHACEIETSYMLYLCPEKVRMEKAICQYPQFPEAFDFTPMRWTELMQTAVLGDAPAATAEKGEAIITAVVEKIVSVLSGDNDL